MDSILQCSKRTITKITERMQLKCFNCGWGEARCDLHHIKPQSKGGSDSPDNLTYLCPNCHRLAHTGKLKVFKSFLDVVGDEWKKFYDVTPRRRATRSFAGKRQPTEALSIARQKRSELALERASEAIKKFEASGIDTTRYGWKQKASEVLGVVPQKVTWYLKKHAPHFLEGAKQRN